MVSGNKPGESNALQVQNLDADQAQEWSWVNSLAVSALMMASCAYGFGQHNSNLSVDNRKMTFKVFSLFFSPRLPVGSQPILAVLCCTSILQAHNQPDKSFNSASISQNFYPEAISDSVLCHSGDHLGLHGRHVLLVCVSIIPKNWYANAGFSIATDFIILVLPMPIIYKSFLPSNQKIALMFVFALGAFVMITSIFRMQTLNFSSTSSDPTYDVLSSLWTIIEENVGIICACLPACRPILTILLPRIFPSSSGNGQYPATPGNQSNTFKHSESAKSGWNPSRGDQDAMGINLTTVKAHGLKGNTSEESILGRHDDSRNDSSENRIHKVTEYYVS
ncbi:hypothetical protein V493_05283 [Pseudogymnoascus sp. VKM F-4281 (FW-2241)]|nr:hypothetical protein V493_05283 [Pseudogymnoascus sp. VKM F-4281 (FW-2241)]